MRDIVSVIGAGTAGLITAERLSRNGIGVRVYEQKRVPGHPIHASGILSINGLASLGIDYRSAVTNTLRGAIVHAGTQHMMVMSGEPVAHVLDRKRLNDICLDRAVASGADVVLSKRVNGAMLDQLSESSVMVGADGATSTVAKHFNMGRAERFIVTYKVEYNVNVIDAETVELFFDNKRYPGLFGWLCPNASDMLEVGIGVDSGFGNSKSAFEGFVKTKKVADAIGGSKIVGEGASIIPIGLRRPFAKDGVVLVGDAAGQVKASTGGGIVFGGRAAIMAADVIKRHLEDGTSLREYERVFRKRYGLELALHSMANRLYSSSRFDVVIAAMNALGIDGFLGKYGDMDTASLVVKRFFLRGLAR